MSPHSVWNLHLLDLINRSLVLWNVFVLLLKIHIAPSHARPSRRSTRDIDDAGSSLDSARLRRLDEFRHDQRSEEKVANVVRGKLNLDTVLAEGTFGGAHDTCAVDYDVKSRYI